MPSTRRSQVSATNQAQGQDEPAISLSPKITRSGRLPPPQDAIEQEGTARSAKRRKTGSPPAPDAIVDQNADESASEGQASESLKSVHRAENSDPEAKVDHEEADVLEEDEDEDEQDVIRNHPAVAGKPEPGPASLLTAPSTASVLVNTPVRDSISALDKLADQILTINIKTIPQDLGSAIKDPGEESGKEYLQLQAQFAAAKRQYSDTRAFMTPTDLGSANPEHVEVCRRVNLVTFIVSLFDGSIGLEDLDNHFLFLFVPRGGTLSKLAASLWIELKTQAFIAAVVTNDPRPPIAVLSVLFNEDVRLRLLEIRLGSEELAPSEEDFVDTMRLRRKALEDHLARDSSQSLAQRYRWMDLLEKAVSYLKILKWNDDQLTGSERLLLKPRQKITQGRTENPLSQTSAPNGEAPFHTAKGTGYLDTPEETFKHRLGRCALLAIQGVGQPYFTVDNLPYPLIPYSTQLQEPWPAVEGEVAATAAKTTTNATTAGEAGIPHSSQKAPTLVLYEQARKASQIEALHPPQPTSVKSTPGARQKWTLEEEHALITGLDRVCGPYWTRILSDEKLKDRDVQQLKDKARGLKLFFLKAGVEVPFYLKDITGDSKSGSTPTPLKQDEESSVAGAASMKADGII